MARPWRDLDDLTEEERSWVEMQAAIDDGLKWCDPCDRAGWRTFCGHCGQRFVGADRIWNDCAKCHATVSTDWCPICGSNVVDEFMRDLAAGRVDWAQRVSIAAENMRKILRFRPDAASVIHPPQKPNLAQAISETWGRSV